MYFLIAGFVLGFLAALFLAFYTKTVAVVHKKPTIEEFFINLTGFSGHPPKKEELKSKEAITLYELANNTAVSIVVRYILVFLYSAQHEEDENFLAKRQYFLDEFSKYICPDIVIKENNSFILMEMKNEKMLLG